MFLKPELLDIATEGFLVGVLSHFSITLFLGFVQMRHP